MCEIAVVVVATVNSDFYLNCMCYQAQDVICAQPDGWNWGVIDQSNSNWRILKFPGLDPSLFASLLLPQPPTTVPPSKTLLRRAQSFNYTALAQAPSVAANAVTAAQVNPYIADATRAAPTLSVPLAAADLPSLTITKALVADPAIVGTVTSTPTNTIG